MTVLTSCTAPEKLLRQHRLSIKKYINAGRITPICNSKHLPASHEFLLSYATVPSNIGLLSESILIQASATASTTSFCLESERVSFFLQEQR